MEQTAQRALSDEFAHQFDSTMPKLRAHDLPVLADRVRDRLGEELTDEIAPAIVKAALLLAVDADDPSAEEPPGALAGALAYFLLDRRPRPEEREAIRLANRPRSAPEGSQPFRFSWARWQQLRVERERQDVSAPQERSGRDRRQLYLAATSRAISAALDRPAELRAMLRRLAADTSWSAELTALLAASDLYVRESALDPTLRIERTIEPALLEDIQDPAHPWQRAIVGDAGTGKSTLLWSLHQRLDEAGDWLPILVGASWLIDYLERNEPQSLIALLLEVRAADRQPILLVDTVDLMLHDESTRQPLLRLMHALVGVDIVGIYSSRPQEAALLTHDDLRRIDLAPYDDEELAGAVSALVTRFCPQASAAVVLDRVRRAQARGLPVEDVCRSPLLLRMLFDLAAPVEPELADMDVTRLFAAYWERRVVRDVRSEVDVRQRTSAATDLSPLAGRVGIGFLASGLPELAESALRDVVVRAGAAAEQVGEGLDILLERGVLERSGERVGFFHQTMFEFAAAKGLLSRGKATALTILAQRSASNAGDLFVGSVLEQTLILAGDNPLMHEAASTAIEQLVATELASLSSIALAAWAHHPSLLDTTGSRLRYVSPEAAERAARLIPAIASKSGGDAVSQLLLLWRRRSAPNVAVAVLEGLARIALRSPDVVAEALEYLDPVEALVQERAPGEVWEALQKLLRTLAGSAPRLVRATLVASLTRANAGRRSLELASLAESWPMIGDENLLREVARAVEADESDELTPASALGRIIAAEWARMTDPDAAVQALAELEQEGEGQELRLIDAARYSAVGAHLAALLAQGDADDLLLQLLDTSRPAARDWVAHHVLHDLLTAPEPAATRVRTVLRAELATVGADAQRGQLTDRQTLILDAFTQSLLPQGLLAVVIPRQLERNDWTASNRLLRLLPLAAADGHENARRLLQHIAHDPTRIRDDDIDALFSTLAARHIQDADTHTLMVTTALRGDRVQNLNALISSAPRRGAGINARVGELLEYSRRLLASDDGRRRADGGTVLAGLMAQADLTMDWPSLRDVLESVRDHTHVLAPLIKNLWQQTPDGDVEPQLDFLRHYVRIEPDAVPPITRAEPGTPVQIAAVAAEAYLRILGLRGGEDPDSWPFILALTLYELDSPEIHVTGMRFVIACDYLQRAGATRPKDAASQLFRLLEGIVNGEFVGVEKMLWRRELRNAIQHTMSGDSGRVITTLTQLCRLLRDPDLIEVIARTLAETDYAQSREHLHRLVPELKHDASRAVLDIVRAHDRSFGTRAFPEIVFVTA
ncbi:MAG TPA: ATP-binding protein [Pseudolysinimonas sp.]|jgi:hypothetical protein|nr:ATP-binding protein [Pseudolysinimonas sp.]